MKEIICINTGSTFRAGKEIAVVPIKLCSVVEKSKYLIIKRRKTCIN